MIETVSLAITVACVGIAAQTGALAGTGRFTATRVRPALHLLEAALVAQAVFDVVGLLRGHQPRDTAEHLCYVVLSVATVPLVAVQARRGAKAAVVIVVGLLFVAVLVMRMQATWRPA